MTIYPVLARGLNAVLAKFHYRIIRLPTPPVNCRVRAIQRYRIDLVLDVGANVGQYAMELRSLGYRGRILSFEPLPDAFAQLSAAAANDPLWEVRNAAAGLEAGRLEMHVSDNSVSSSLLPVNITSVAAAPGSKATHSVEVDVITLASLLANETGKRILLKIDTQGYEWQVLMGCGNAIDYVTALDVEMSLQPLYDGQALFDQVDKWIVARGYRRVGIDTSFWNRETGELLQLDGIYARD
jgi:FkbM family methyltransferase